MLLNDTHARALLNDTRARVLYNDTRAHVLLNDTHARVLLNDTRACDTVFGLTPHPTTIHPTIPTNKHTYQQQQEGLLFEICSMTLP